MIYFKHHSVLFIDVFMINIRKNNIHIENTAYSSETSKCVLDQQLFELWLLLSINACFVHCFSVYVYVCTRVCSSEISFMFKVTVRKEP